jgi:hypothetical protein
VVSESSLSLLTTDSFLKNQNQEIKEDKLFFFSFSFTLSLSFVLLRQLRERERMREKSGVEAREKDRYDRYLIWPRLF